MSQLMAQMRINRALRHNTPPCADLQYNPDDLVLIWGKNLVNNRIGEVLGPLKVSSFNRQTKVVHVKDRNTSSIQAFNIIQVKTFFDPDVLSSEFLQQLKPSLSRFQSPKPSEDIFMTKILKKSDPRTQIPDMTKVRRFEMENILKRETFKVILK